MASKWISKALCSEYCTVITTPFRTPTPPAVWFTSRPTPNAMQCTPLHLFKHQNQLSTGHQSPFRVVGLDLNTKLCPTIFFSTHFTLRCSLAWERWKRLRGDRFEGRPRLAIIVGLMHATLYHFLFLSL